MPSDPAKMKSLYRTYRDGGGTRTFPDFVEAYEMKQLEAKGGRLRGLAPPTTAFPRG